MTRVLRGGGDLARLRAAFVHSFTHESASPFLIRPATAKHSPIGLATVRAAERDREAELEVVVLEDACSKRNPRWWSIH